MGVYKYIISLRIRLLISIVFFWIIFNSTFANTPLHPLWVALPETPALTLKLQEQGIRGLLRGGTHIGCLQLTDAWPGEVGRTSDKWTHIHTSVKPHFFTSVLGAAVPKTVQDWSTIAYNVNLRQNVDC